MRSGPTGEHFPNEALRSVEAAPRSLFRMVAATVRNPLDALPPEVFEAGLVRSTVLGTTLVHVMAPELVQALLLGEAEALGKTAAIRRALGPALGDGLLTSDGAQWRWQRRLLASAFRPDSLAGFVPAMIGAARRGCDRLEVASAAGGTVDIGREMMLTTFDIIVETMLSGRGAIDAERVASGAADYLRQTGWALALSMLRAPAWTPYPGRRRGRRAADFLRGAVGAVVAERRRTGEARDDLVDRLLGAVDPETGKRMDDREIADNLLTFVAAGHETTALGLAWTLDLLSREARARDAVLAELDAVLGDRAIEPGDVERLVVTRRTFQEGMRLYPPAPLISRQARVAIRFGGERYAAGTRFVVPIYAIHRHRALWPEPDRFEPDRFGPDQVAERHRFAFMPFGAGPRVCIGSGFATAEAVVILACILQRFRLEASTAAAPGARMEITLRPMQPLLMRVGERLRPERGPGPS